MYLPFGAAARMSLSDGIKAERLCQKAFFARLVRLSIFLHISAVIRGRRRVSLKAQGAAAEFGGILRRAFIRCAESGQRGIP